MKKVYEKPRATVEYFTLTQNIALDCGYNDSYIGRPNQSEKGQCGWIPNADYDFGVVYWTSSASKCSGNYSPDLPGLEVCYDAPAGVPTIFAS